MVASVSSDYKLDNAPPSLVPATTSSSPATTPSRTDKPPPSKRTPPNSRSKKKRIHPEQVQVPPSENAPSHELFGDYMSIEEIAAQTEKAYQSRKKSGSSQSSCSSPVRTLSNSISTRNRNASPTKGAGSPRRLKAIPKVANCTAGSHTKQHSYAKIMFTLFMMTVLLPFLLCETFLLVLTLRHTIETKPDLSYVHSNFHLIDLAESDVLHDNEVVNKNIIANNNDEEPDQSRSDELEEIVTFSAKLESMSEQHIEQEVDHMSGQETNQEEITLSSESETIIKQPNVYPTLKEEVLSADPEIRKTQPNIDPIFEYQMILKEAFHLIAAARSLSSTEDNTHQISNSETLCRQVLSHAQEMISQLNPTIKEDPWEILYFQSKLCLGMVKMSLSDNHLMLQEAKQEFLHLVSSVSYK